MPTASGRSRELPCERSGMKFWVSQGKISFFFNWPAHQSHHCGSVLAIDKQDLTVENSLFLALKTKFQPITQLNFENKSAPILMKPSPIAWKWSRVGQIWSQIKKLFFLQIGEGSTPTVKPKTLSQNVHIYAHPWPPWAPWPERAGGRAGGWPQAGRPRPQLTRSTGTHGP